MADEFVLPIDAYPGQYHKLLGDPSFNCFTCHEQSFGSHSVECRELPLVLQSSATNLTEQENLLISEEKETPRSSPEVLDLVTLPEAPDKALEIGQV